MDFCWLVPCALLCSHMGFVSKSSSRAPIMKAISLHRVNDGNQPATWAQDTDSKNNSGKLAGFLAEYVLVLGHGFSSPQGRCHLLDHRHLQRWILLNSLASLVTTYCTREQCSPFKKTIVQRRKLPDPERSTPPSAHCFPLEVCQIISPRHCAFLRTLQKSRHPARDYILHQTKQRRKEQFKCLGRTKLVDLPWSKLGKAPANFSARGAVEAVSWGREQLCSAEWQPLVHVLLFMEEDICPRLDTSRFFHTANTHS